MKALQARQEGVLSCARESVYQQAKESSECSLHVLISKIFKSFTKLQ